MNASSSLPERSIERRLRWALLRLLLPGAMVVASIIASIPALTVQAAGPSEDTAGQADESPPRRVKGRVVDRTGAGIPRAGVWFPMQFFEPRHIVYATSDDDGHFELEVPGAWINPVRSMNLWEVWAHTADHAIGAASASAALFSEAPSEPLRITLEPKTNTSFVVYDPQGKAVVGATVRPLNFQTRTGFSIVPDEIADRISATTDSQGRARLPAMPLKGFFRVEVRSGKFGTQRRRLDHKNGVAARIVNLRPVGRIEGRVVASDPAMAKGIRLFFETEPSRWSLDATNGFSDVTTDDEGKFAVPAIAHGSIRIMDALDPKLPGRMRYPERLQLEAAKTESLELQLVDGVRGRGQIRMSQSDRPVAGARISIRYGRFRQGDDVISDEHGRFEARVLPGSGYQQVIEMPAGIDAVQPGSPWEERFDIPTKVTEFELPTIELAPAIYVPGQLLDANGKPVVGASVTGLRKNRLFGFAKTDENGEFRLRLPKGVNMPSYRVSLDDVRYEPTVEKLMPLHLRVTVD